MSSKMPTLNFLGLPRELRDQIYELVLLHEEPIDPWAGFFSRQKLTPGLFRVNKAIHNETISLFYTWNSFDFTTGHPENITSFLEQIGQSNADFIRHIYVDFPKLFLENDCIALDEDSISTLATLQSNCEYLRTLTLPQVCSTSLAPLNTDPQAVGIIAATDPETITEAVELVNTHIRSISSLQDIIIELYEDSPSDHIRGEMERLGWKIHQIDEAAFRDDLGSDRDDYDDDYSGGWGYGDGDGDDDANDYDIDDDSDFWRRAAD